MLTGTMQPAACCTSLTPDAIAPYITSAATAVAQQTGTNTPINVEHKHSIRVQLKPAVFWQTNSQTDIIEAAKPSAWPPQPFGAPWGCTPPTASWCPNGCQQPRNTLCWVRYQGINQQPGSAACKTTLGDQQPDKSVWQARTSMHINNANTIRLGATFDHAIYQGSHIYGRGRASAHTSVRRPQ